jgi:hypothetical protein
MGITHDDNQMCMMNIDANMDDLKDYAGELEIL